MSCVYSPTSDDEYDEYELEKAPTPPSSPPYGGGEYIHIPQKDDEYEAEYEADDEHEDSPPPPSPPEGMWLRMGNRQLPGQLWGHCLFMPRPPSPDGVDVKLEEDQTTAAVSSGESSHYSGRVFPLPADSPYGYHMGEGVDAGRNDVECIVNSSGNNYDPDAIFKRLASVTGRVRPSAVQEVMMKSELPDTVLKKIWQLADVDQDGLLDKEEFDIAMYLIDLQLQGHDLPMSIPLHWVHPSKRLKGKPRRLSYL